MLVAGESTGSRAAVALVRERPYHAALSAFAIGLGCAASAPRFALSAAALALVALAALRAPALGLACAVLVLGGAAVGTARLAAIDAPARRLPTGSGVDVRAELLERPRRSPFGSRAEVRIVSGPARGARLLARAPRTLGWPRKLAVGAELRLRGFVRRPRERPNADFDFAAYLRRRAIAAELWLDSAEATGRRRGGSAGVFDAIRRRAERALEAGMSPSEATLARSMVLGQDERIDAPTREDWRAAGLAHLLVVSGQNITLLAALAAPLLAAAGLGLRRRALALLLLIAVYVPVAGAGPSLQRAGVMGAAGIGAMALSRPASRWYVLLLAAVATLAVNPRSWTDPAWQLSFSAVMGILCLGPPLARVFGATLEALFPGRSHPAGRRPLARAVAEAGAITVAATVATAPLLAHHFGSVSVAGLPANLLALPAVVPAMWLGMVKAGLGQLAVLGPPVEPLAGALATALGTVAQVPVAYLAALAEGIADLPYGQVAMPLSTPVSVLVAYGVLGLAAVAIGRIVRLFGPRGEEMAAAWRRHPSATRAALGLVLLAALVLWAARATAPPPPPGRLTVRFLDVGQGDATLVQHPDGTAVLFDGGPPAGGIARLLRAAGVRNLAVLVATHASLDHHGGLREVLAGYPVGTLLDGSDGTRDPGFRAVLAEAARRGVRRARAVAPMTLRAGGLSLRILSPPPRPAGPPPEDPNPRAVVAVVSAGGFDLLLSADAESESLLPLDLPDVEAMKVPHHGSADPGLPAVLERVDPEIAAIEVGPNTYGHPAPSTLAALARAGARTYRTDRDGTITLTVGAGAVRVRTEG